MHHRTRAAILVLALGTLTLTGCSESKNTTGTASSPSTNVTASTSATPAKSADDKSDKSADDGKAALEKSVRAYTKALFGNDPKGYDLVSKRCQAEMTAVEFATMSKQAHHDYGQLEIKNLSVDQISGDLARVSYGVGVPQFERKAQPWTREKGTWRWDACQASGQ
ncbi:hypothetical protein ACFC5Z_40080 [Streptomyces sp. NPDC056004]|uniref:hypothetical protein n=1 Tax=Streptomyces sp. NPDC056004 TaxID=3345677 RepID=UPI0035D67896